MAILAAAIIIAGAVFLSRGGATVDVFKAQPQATGQSQQSDITAPQAINSRPVDSSDHIIGNPNANIVMVEYSDLECPFCKAFHATLQSIIGTYGKTGQVAWVYRHFPLSIHPRSPKESQAAECAWQLAGNDGFWNYVNKVFSVTPSNNGLDPAQLPVIAGEIGLNVDQFNTCLNSGKYASKIQADYNDGLNAGVNGTPNTVLVLKTPLTDAQAQQLSGINQSFMQNMAPGSPNVITIDPSKLKVDIGGAIPAQTMKQIIDLLLGK